MEEAPVNACPPGFRPWVHFGFHFVFLHFWVYSAFVLEKLLPACGNRLSPWCPGHWCVPPLITSSSQPHFLCKIHLHVTTCSPRIASHHVCDHARCGFPPTFKEQDGWLLAGLLLTASYHLCIWFLSRGKATRYHSVPLKTPSFPGHKQLNLSRCGASWD